LLTILQNLIARQLIITDYRTFNEYEKVVKSMTFTVFTLPNTIDVP